MEDQRNFRSVSSRFTWIGVLVSWFVVTAMLWDPNEDDFNWTKGIVFWSIVCCLALATSRFTIRLLARPSQFFEVGIPSAQGRLEPIQISPTHDQVEYPDETSNGMAGVLTASKEGVRQNRMLLEERLRSRTSELETAMNAAFAASRAKSEFLANMSHELRTPMNGLLGMLDVVLDSTLAAEQRDQIETAQRCAYSLLGLLNEILDLSKIEAGKMLFERTPMDVPNVVEDSVNAYLAKAQQKGIALKFEADGEARTVRRFYGDPLRLRQIVTNLISNGVKFTEHGSISIRLSICPARGATKRRTISVEVKDSGCGISKDQLLHIFDKFTQADSSTTRKFGGTGLGLAIVKKLVELQGGSIRAESVENQGSTFTISIPFEIAPVAERTATEAVSAAPLKDGSHVRVLLVEDNLVNQKLVLAVLQKKGFHIDIANDGHQALSILAEMQDPYSVVLMDVQMPGMDGMETTRRLRSDPRWEKLPVIAMTAHAMNGDRERCLEAGMNAYIAKPVQPGHLISTIQKHSLEALR